MATAVGGCFFTFCTVLWIWMPVLFKYPLSLRNKRHWVLLKITDNQFKVLYKCWKNFACTAAVFLSTFRLCFHIAVNDVASLRQHCWQKYFFIQNIFSRILWLQKLNYLYNRRKWIYKKIYKIRNINYSETNQDFWDCKTDFLIL